MFSQPIQGKVYLNLLFSFVDGSALPTGQTENPKTAYCRDLSIYDLNFLKEIISSIFLLHSSRINIINGI